MSIETASLEHPRSEGEQKQLLADISVAFEEFKQSNDARLEEIENRHAADVLTSDKVERINNELSRLSTLVQRPALAAHEGQDDTEAKAQFEAYARGQHIGPAEQKASSVDLLSLSATDKNTFFVPEVVERRIDEAISSRSALRRLASQTVLENGSELKFIHQHERLAASWVKEDAARDKTTVPTFKEVSIALHELYASPSASQRFIDDSDIDVGAWLMHEVAEAFAEAENKAFIVGTGTDQPTGALVHNTTFNDANAHFELQLVKSRNADGFAAGTVAEVLAEVVLKLPSHYYSNAAWLMNTSTQAKLRSLKDSKGNYVWAVPNTLDQAPSLLGFPVYDEPHMHSISALNTPVLFGDFGRGFRVVRSSHTSMIRDPYSNKPNVTFYTTRRVGGGVIDTRAIRGIKIAS